MLSFSRSLPFFCSLKKNAGLCSYFNEYSKQKNYWTCMRQIYNYCHSPVESLPSAEVKYFCLLCIFPPLLSVARFTFLCASIGVYDDVSWWRPNLLFFQLFFSIRRAWFWFKRKNIGMHNLSLSLNLSRCSLLLRLPSQIFSLLYIDATVQYQNGSVCYIMWSS